MFADLRSTAKTFITMYQFVQTNFVSLQNRLFAAETQVLFFIRRKEYVRAHCVTNYFL